MKKLFLIPILTLSVLLSAQTTGFKAGVYLGIPIADASDYSNFNLGLDISYLFWEPVENLKIGASTGYSHFFGKDIDNVYGQHYKIKAKDFGFIPLAVTGEYYFAQQFFAGVDLGVAIATESNKDTGFYYRPKVGWDQEFFQVFLYGTGITQGGSDIFGSIGIGGAYKF